MRGWLAWLCLVLVISCSGSAVVGGDDDGGDGCQSNDDCPGSDMWCSGDAGCDAAWSCVPNPCSAAPPQIACLCSGVFDTRDAGCPRERYAYDFHIYDTTIGAPCDVDAGDLTVRLSGFAASSNLTVRYRTSSNVVVWQEIVSTADGLAELTVEHGLQGMGTVEVCDPMLAQTWSATASSVVELDVASPSSMGACE